MAILCSATDYYPENGPVIPQGPHVALHTAILQQSRTEVTSLDLDHPSWV